MVTFCHSKRMQDKGTAVPLPREMRLFSFGKDFRSRMASSMLRTLCSMDIVKNCTESGYRKVRKCRCTQTPIDPDIVVLALLGSHPVRPHAAKDGRCRQTQRPLHTAKRQYHDPE